jgi:hypothetical protein
MSLAIIAAWCAGSDRIAKRPPCTRGCSVSQRRGRAAGREEIDAEGLEGMRQIEEARFVGDGEKRPPDPDDIRGH